MTGELHIETRVQQANKRQQAKVIARCASIPLVVHSRWDESKTPTENHRHAASSLLRAIGAHSKEDGFWRIESIRMDTEFNGVRFTAGWVGS